MDRVAVFVDAGYFFAAGGKAAYDITQRNRLGFPNPRKCVDDIIKRAADLSRNDNLLRVYWYDALTGTTPTATQSTIAHLHGVKLRLGVVNRTGEQKGVDSLIVTDLIDLARNRAIIDAVLIAGDEDLRVAVQVAQAYGVRVHILAAGNPNRNVSPSLQMEADSVYALDEEWFKEHLTAVSVERPAQHESTPLKANLNVIEAANKTVNEILTGARAEDITMLASHFATSTEVPGEYDRRLIACTAGYVGRKLTGTEMRQIRGIFVRQVRERNTQATS
jgi:uncharacterized LabA/DUF88 family protein